MRLLIVLMFVSTISVNVDENVVATVYNAVPEQTNSDPGHTASMFKLDLSNPYKHRIIAVSRDLLVSFPMGTRVRVEGTSYDGIYVVEDKMNKWTTFWGAMGNATIEEVKRTAQWIMSVEPKI